MSKQYLRLFLDTTDLHEVERALQKEILSGITTTNDHLADVEKIAELCKKHNQEVPISIEVSETEPEKMIKQAREFSAKINYSNLNVKIPIGWEATRVIRELEKNDIKVNCTCGTNEAQAILAANSGARYFSIFASQIKDMGGDPFGVIKKSRKLLEGSDTEIIVADIRPKNMRDVVDAFLAGAHIVSVPLDVLEGMASHPETTKNIIRFVNAFHQWGKK